MFNYLKSTSMKTTGEQAREDSHKETVNVLQNIIEKNYDAEKAIKKQC